MSRRTTDKTHLSEPRQAAAEETVLIVEDENLVALDVEQTLKEFGYSHVVVTATLQDARHQMKIHGNKILLVILDVKLEDGDGTSLIEEFHARGTHVVVMTGYCDFYHENVPVLRKPFSTMTLVQTIRSLLGQSV